jgi:hypothetical protein
MSPVSSLTFSRAHFADQPFGLPANVRHELERHGRDAVTALLKQYQQEIVTDWIAAYHKYVSKTP